MPLDSSTKKCLESAQEGVNYVVRGLGASAKQLSSGGLPRGPAPTDCGGRRLRAARGSDAAGAWRRAKPALPAGQQGLGLSSCERPWL